MKLKLRPKILETPIEEKIKKALENATDIKDKIYLSIAYFQYINKLSANKAFYLFKEYILSDGQKSSYPLGIYFAKDGTLVTKKIQIPLKIDEFLSRFIPEIMQHKDLVNKINKSTYLKYVRTHLKINASDITAYAIYKMLIDIGIYNLIALKRHWYLFSRNVIPYLLKNKKIYSLA